MNLPDIFLEELKNLIGDDELDLYLKSFSQKKHIGIRINTSKISIEDFINLFPMELKKIPFIENGFFVDDTDAVSKHPYYFAGLYYIQEPSAMVPASLLNISSKDRVLDLCAAPGGKATEIISKNPEFLLANDISYSRTIPLVKNLEMFGARNYCVSAENPKQLLSKYPLYFDKIIVDAPCSGEGMFRKDSSLIASWLKKGPKEYVDTQLEILADAVKMLKPGGELVYSTCTFSICEDEEIIGKILTQNNDLKLVSLKHDNGFKGGYTSEAFPDYDFSGCIRLFPHLIDGEGHFVAKLRKDTSLYSNNLAVKSKFKIISRNKLPQKVLEFLSNIDNEYLSDSFYTKDDLIFMLNESEIDSLRNGIRYSRTGSLIGKIKPNGHFDVHSGFALTLTEKAFNNVLNLSANDINIFKYLKGETLTQIEDLSNIKKGYVLICVDHYPLGFLKFDGVKFKNLYAAGWRLNV